MEVLQETFVGDPRESFPGDIWERVLWKTSAADLREVFKAGFRESFAGDICWRVLPRLFRECGRFLEELFAETWGRFLWETFAGQNCRSLA